MRPGAVRTRSLLLCVAALAVLAACGKSKEEERFEANRATCLGLVGKTVTQAEQEYGFQSFISECRTDLFPVEGQTCTQGVSLCVLAWNFLATDRAVCSQFGCYYGCGARVVQSELQGQGGSAVVCGVEFTSGQPFPPFQ